MLNERKRKWFDAVVWSVSLLFAASPCRRTARAESHRYAVDNAAYRAECGSCHVAYPPALAWDADGLARDHATGWISTSGRTPASAKHRRAELTAYLAGSSAESAARRPTLASRRPAGSARSMRRSQPRPGSSPTVKSAANCEACHRQASSGDFSERTIRVPREGLAMNDADQDKTLVWDLPTRVFHWLLAATFVGAYRHRRERAPARRSHAARLLGGGARRVPPAVGHRRHPLCALHVVSAVAARGGRLPEVAADPLAASLLRAQPGGQLGHPRHAGLDRGDRR